MIKKLMGNMMDSALQWLHLTCRDNSPIISEMMDHRVSWGKSLKARIHLALCEVCQYYKIQLETLTRLARELGREDSAARNEMVLSAKAKEQIKKALKPPL